MAAEITSTMQSKSQQQSPAQVQAQRPPYVSLTDRYRVLRRVGRSSEGIVNLAQSLSDPAQLRVMKIVTHHDRINAPHEARMLHSLGKHENVVQFFEAEGQFSCGVAIICLEWCSLGDLYGFQRHLHNMKLPTPAAVVLKAIVDVCEGLAFIHGGWIRDADNERYRVTTYPHRNLVHRDLKPENIFIRSTYGKPPVSFVIADFGQAFDPALVNHRGGGTQGFRAPEFYVLNQPPLTAKADVYAFAIAMLSLCQGLEAPLFGCGQNPAGLRLPRHLASLGIQALLRRCLECNPKDRPDMSPAGALWYVPGFRKLLEGMRDDVVLPPGASLPGPELGRAA